LVLADDEPSYRDFCARMVKQFGDTSVDWEADMTCKSCLLLPRCVDMASLPLSVLSDKLDDNTSRSPVTHWQWSTLALAAYRSGDLERVSTYTSKAFESQPTLSSSAMINSIEALALAKHGRGNLDGALDSLHKATTMIKQNMPGSPAGEVHNWMIALIIASEAEKTLEGDTADIP
jgi:hypothetical protein